MLRGTSTARISNSVEPVPIMTAPASDPLLYNPPLPLRLTLYPLGFPLIIETNSEDVRRAAEESWPAGAMQVQFDTRPIHIRAGVFGNQLGARRDPPVFRAYRGLISIVADAGNSAVSDLKNGSGFCWVTPQVAASRDYFRYFFLEALAYSLLSSLYLSPVHGACVERKGRGVLLCGDSGAGKSSLAYACARRGWTYVCDDAVNIVRDANPGYVVGNCASLRLRPDAPRLFPELAPRAAGRRPNGKTNIELRTATLHALRTRGESHVSHVIFLNRSRVSWPRLEAVPAAVARQRLSDVPRYGLASMHAAWKRSVRALVKHSSAHEFFYSDIDAAVTFLEAFVDDAG